MLDLLVVVSCYNYGKYLKECVDSILSNVTTLNYKIVIVDDCSEDDSYFIAKSLESENVISVGLTKNSKTSAVRNHGINLIQSKYVLCIDADDKIPSDYIESLYNTLKSFDVDIVYTNSKCFGDNNNFHNWQEFDINRLRRSNFINCSALFKREVWEKNKFDENMIFGLEDYDFWLMAAKENFKFKKCNSTALFWRIKKASRDSDSHFYKNSIYKYLRSKHNGWYTGP